MFTLKKVAPVLGVLALALVSGSAQAENKAVWTAKNGWSTEPACEKNDGGRYCWVLTKGMEVLYPDHWGASLMYECNTQNDEWLYISFYSTLSPRKDDPSLRARWGREFRERIDTQVETQHARGKRRYFYSIKDTHDFIDKMKMYKSLHVFIPQRAQPYEVRFKLANAIPSIKRAMDACRLIYSTVGDIKL